MSFGYVVVQIRGLQAQLADARQEQKEQAADKEAVQARLEAANVKSASHRPSLQVCVCAVVGVGIARVGRHVVSRVA